MSLQSQPDESPRRARGSDQTRSSLIAAGTELFAEKGFDAATTDLIARRAGVNKALINYHFGGKAGLYATILTTTFSEIDDRLKQLDSMSEPADACLREFITLFAGMNSRRPSFSTMVLREVLSGGRHLDEEVLPHFLSIFAHVRRIVARGIREGTFRPVDPLLTHLSLIGSLVFFFATSPLRRRLVEEKKVPLALPTTEEFVAHISEIMTRGLAGGAPSGSAPPGERRRPDSRARPDDTDDTRRS